jgi:predicted nucleic acid-binding protein
VEALRIYLDTSVISHLFHDDAPEWKAATEELFANTIAPGVHEAFVSTLVLDELDRTREPELRAKLLDVVRRYDLAVLPQGEQKVDDLAQLYLQQGIVPAAYPEDALHVAYATVFEMDVLVTWNFRHLAKARTADLVAGVNFLEGYTRPLKLLTPLEVLAP